MLGEIELIWVEKWSSWIWGGDCKPKKQNTCCIMRILCPSDFKELTEKLISLLLYTTENFEEKIKLGYILYHSVITGLISAFCMKKLCSRAHIKKKKKFLK